MDCCKVMKSYDLTNKKCKIICLKHFTKKHRGQKKLVENSSRKPQSSNTKKVQKLSEKKHIKTQLKKKVNTKNILKSILKVH